MAFNLLYNFNTLSVYWAIFMGLFEIIGTNYNVMSRFNRIVTNI